MKQTFMGLPLSQEWADIAIWETFFNEFPAKSFIELGTGNGGMSVFFALQCYQRDIQFVSFDNQKWINYSFGIPKILRMQDGFFHMDIFREGLGVVEGAIKTLSRPLVVFFDNGDKPREWKTFAPLTRPGDFLAVHDFGVEFRERDIGDVPVERILTAECDARPQTGYKTMWFKRI
jgi:cephalosporin hydroxylase